MVSAPPSAPSGKQWNLVWTDEFDGSSLNNSKWDTKLWYKKIILLFLVLKLIYYLFYPFMYLFIY